MIIPFRGETGRHSNDGTRRTRDVNNNATVDSTVGPPYSRGQPPAAPDLAYIALQQAP